ncbi:hypothetical protein L6249_03920, partial [Candidatus Parcubacteria bacterium]|nr:hypothetical protein [Candidatus Parcubacteria bacterium]
MNSEKIIVVTLNLKYEFKTGVKKELNLYNNITAVITEIKSPGRLCQLKYQKLVAELRWSLCKYYRECSDDFL